MDMSQFVAELAALTANMTALPMDDSGRGARGRNVDLKLSNLVGR